MKRFWSLALLTLLSAGVNYQTLAVTDCGTIIYEAVLDQDTDYDNSEYDLTQYAISADLPLDNFKLGFDCTYSRLEQDSLKEYEGYAYKLKGGIALANTDRIRLDLSAGYFYGDYQDQLDDFKITYKSCLVGLDTKLALSERVWLNATCAYGVNPQISYGSGADFDLDQLTLANVRLNFQFLEDTGLSVGYRWETFKNDLSRSEYNIENKGYTIGLSYIF
jgi:hypothetical protein